MLLHGASDLDQRCLKTRRSVVVAFLGGLHQIYLPLPPKLLPKPHFGDLSMQYAKPIIDRALHEWHVNGAEIKNTPRCGKVLALGAKNFR